MASTPVLLTYFGKGNQDVPTTRKNTLQQVSLSTYNKYTVTLTALVVVFSVALSVPVFPSLLTLVGTTLTGW